MTRFYIIFYTMEITSWKYVSRYYNDPKMRVFNSMLKISLFDPVRSCGHRETKAEGLRAGLLVSMEIYRSALLVSCWEFRGLVRGLGNQDMCCIVGREPLLQYGQFFSFWGLNCPKSHYTIGSWVVPKSMVHNSMYWINRQPLQGIRVVQITVIWVS